MFFIGVNPVNAPARIIQLERGLNEITSGYCVGPRMTLRYAVT